jgi:hypothetical protein
LIAQAAEPPYNPLGSAWAVSGTGRPGAPSSHLMKEPLMFSPKLRLLLGLAAVTALALALTASSPVNAGDGGFVKVFNGKDMTGFKYVVAIPKTVEVDGKKKTVFTLEKGDDPLKSSTKTWKVEDGIIMCTGKPNGYFYMDKNLKNYVVKFDWKYARPPDLKDDEKFLGNSGYLAHITGDHKVWPKCVEIQGMNKEHAKIFAIGGAKGKYTFDADALKKARKPVGEWNTTEIIFDGGKITSKVNGVVIGDGEGELSEGPWGMQSEGAEIHFKNIMIMVKK